MRPHVTRHLSYLDGIRGLAALAVALFGHYIHFFQPYVGGVRANAAPGYFLLWPLYDRPDVAVYVFFALSGVVFAHVYGEQVPRLVEFVRRRFARLYPLHFATLLATAALAIAFHVIKGRWPVYADNGPVAFVSNLLFVQFGIFRLDYSFNGPAWSLSIEAVMYVTFWFAASRRIAGLLAWFIALGTTAYLSSPYTWHDRPVVNMPMAMGALGFFGGMIFYRSWRQGAVLWILLLGLYLWRGVAAGWFYLPIFGMIYATLHWRPLQVALSLTMFRWLGKRSLAIYLCHFPVQIAIILILGENLPVQSPLFFFGYASVLLLVAEWAHRWIEVPARSLVRSPKIDAIV